MGMARYEPLLQQPSSTKTLSHPGLVVSTTISASLMVLLSQLPMVFHYNGQLTGAANVQDLSPGAEVEIACDVGSCWLTFF